MKSILKPCPFCGSLEIAIGSDADCRRKERVYEKV
jgi:predicted RNA-binding Zn-ribbon protein involved in translation (DUF1610 family)